MGQKKIDVQWGRYHFDDRLLNAYWSPNPNQTHHEHNYGDGQIHNKHETVEGLLAQEVRDLEELGMDFDDIIGAIEPVISGLRKSCYDAVDRTEHAGVGTAPDEITPFHCINIDYDTNYFQHVSDTDPSITGSTRQWRYCVIAMPFRGIQTSVLDHRYYNAAQKGWGIPLSETTLSLYKNRIVEGFYLPHYRISAARAVWALGVGSPEQQAKAMAIDWRNTTKILKEAEEYGDRITLDLIMNYMIEYFPRDDSYWKEHGFEGYKYGERSFNTLRDMLTSLKQEYEQIPYPPGTIPLTGGIRNID